MKKKSLDELDELEDDLDDNILSSYRSKRISEMKAQAAKEKYGAFKQISEKEFILEVSKADKDTWVVLHLFIHSKPACQVLNQCLDSLSKKHKTIKFLKIISRECIHNYPDSASPTIILYKNGDVVKQIVGIDAFGGLKMTADSLEWCLSQNGYGVLKTSLKDNPLLKLSQNQVKLNRNTNSAFISKGKNKKDEEEEEQEEDEEDD